MSEHPSPVSSPPKGIPSSPSIFAYQTRLLQRTSSTTNNPVPVPASNHRTTPGSTSASQFSSLADMAKGGSPPAPPDTPIRRNVARMIGENGIGSSGGAGQVGLGLGMGMGGAAALDRGHSRRGKSMDLARGWEAKISQANDTISNSSPTKGSVRQSPSIMAPPPVHTGTATPPSSSFQSVRSSPLTTPDAGTSIGASTSRAQKRTTVSGMDGFDASKLPESTSSTSTGSGFRARPASISSYTSILSPHSTGDSSVASSRSQATEDRLAKAKANALKRREAKAAATGQSIDTVKAIDTIKAVSTPAGEVADAILTVKTPLSPTPASTQLTPVKGSPFASVFAKPEDEDLTPRRPIQPLGARDTPTSSRMSARNIFEPPSSAAAASGPSSTKAKYVPSGLSLGQPSVSSGLAPAAGPSSDKYGSISKTDRRRLGRHLPRIASGGEGWEGDDTERVVSGQPRVPSTLGRQAQVPSSSSKEEENIPPPSPSKPTFTSTPMPTRPRAAEILAPSKSSNVPVAPAPSTPSTVSKRRSAYMSQANKPDLPSHVGVNAPRPEVAGEEMKGLMNAVGAMSVRGAAKDSAEGVTGKLRVDRVCQGIQAD